MVFGFTSHLQTFILWFSHVCLWVLAYWQWLSCWLSLRACRWWPLSEEHRSVLTTRIKVRLLPPSPLHSLFIGRVCWFPGYGLLFLQVYFKCWDLREGPMLVLILPELDRRKSSLQVWLSKSLWYISKFLPFYFSFEKQKYYGIHRTHQYFWLSSWRFLHPYYLNPGFSFSPFVIRCCASDCPAIPIFKLKDHPSPNTTRNLSQEGRDKRAACEGDMDMPHFPIGLGDRFV